MEPESQSQVTPASITVVGAAAKWPQLATPVATGHPRLLDPPATQALRRCGSIIARLSLLSGADQCTRKASQPMSPVSLVIAG